MLIEIPVQDYHLCLPRFPLYSAEYRILKNGIQLRNDQGEEVVQVLCDPEMAIAIKKLFADNCPESADRVKVLQNNGS